LFFGLALGGAAAACDLGSLGSVSPGDVAKAAANCPSLGSASAAAAVDFAATFGIAADAGAKVKAGVVAALELRAFAAKLDADLKLACGGLANDLGAGGAFASGEQACKAAAKAIGDAKLAIGGDVRLALAIEPPRCAVAIDAMAGCLAECDATIEPGKAELTCSGGELSGRCGGSCTGACTVEGGASCSGTCRGSCSAEFSGTCGGLCTGKCDGKLAQDAQCGGRCEGSCSAAASGTCGGQCGGECELAAAASCAGECRGSCSVEFEAPRCSGELQAPKASADCKAQCDARLDAQVQCTPGRVALTIEGAKDIQAALRLRAAIERNLPAVIAVAVGMKDRALAAAADVRVAIEGAQAGIKAAGDASAEAGARLAACTAAPFKAALDAAASVKVSVDVSVQVQASASGSARAG
jgi:hypothetical protein